LTKEYYTVNYKTAYGKTVYAKLEFGGRCLYQQYVAYNRAHRIHYGNVIQEPAEMAKNRRHGVWRPGEVKVVHGETATQSDLCSRAFCSCLAASDNSPFLLVSISLYDNSLTLMEG